MTTYYTYITDTCREDAKTHGVTGNIEKLADKLEKEQSARQLERFSPPYLKKSFGRPGRLIIQECITGDDIVLFFVRYMTRGSSDYGDFCKDTQRYYERNSIAQSEVDQFLTERKRKPVQKKSELSAAELAYLQSAIADRHTNERAYLESNDWVERISQDWAKEYLPRYYDLITELENGKLREETVLLQHKLNSSITILFRIFPEQKRIFLIAPIDQNKAGDEKKLKEQYGDILYGENVPNNELIRRSRRAYPAFIACDEDTWMKVEKSVEANLALSPEEEDVLESVAMNVADQPKYPLFINGRPGSGKSTILQYLFADHLADFVQSKEKNPNIASPIYLTYSKPLLEQARAAVKNILYCGARNNTDGKNSLVAKEKWPALERECFGNFREFLRSLLPLEIQGQFTYANHLDFARFRKRWNEKRDKHPDREVREIDAELAWHAIRTFIKGMQRDADAIVDPEYYELELSRDKKSIADDKFKLIFEQVWEAWYEKHCREEGLWDDQDLAREVLTSSVENFSRYSAVFCDESQDFTTIELELIERLSVYSDRRVPSHLIKCIPFAFAGDPFQTLNPTGFNWSAMQSSFHDNIVKQLDPGGEAKLAFNFKELAFNYRSSEHIVKLANLVQLLRAVLLGIKGLRPQHSWTMKTTVTPVRFRRDAADCQKAIREQEELVIIIPCQENGEKEYVERDEFLKSVAISAGEISRNILSPARAKGLEYDRVLLYGFGDKVIEKLPDLLDYIMNPGKEPPAIDLRLPWEYFLNQFYVAVSRARKRLFIVDSGEALQRFWSFANENRQKDLLDLHQHRDGWSMKRLGGTVLGESTSWRDDRDDPLELARQWQTQGRTQRDPYLLRLAKDNFKRAGHPEEAQLCRAEQCEYAGEFKEAAKLFSDLRQPEGACRCYWADKDFDAIIALAREFAEITADPRYRAASVVKREKSTADHIDRVLQALHEVDTSSFPDMPGELDAWRGFFALLIDKLAGFIDASEPQKAEWKPAVDRLIEAMQHFELPLHDYPKIARLHCLVGDFAQTVKHWKESCGQRKPDPKHEPWVIQALAKTESYPANISSYHELGDHRAVIDTWRAAGGATEQDLPVSSLLDSALNLGDQEAVRVLLPVSDSLSTLHDALKKTGAKHLQSLLGAIPVAVAHSLEDHGDWGQLLRFVSDQSTPNRALNSLIRDAGIDWPKEVLVASAVRVMSRSDRLANESAVSQRDVSDFLKKNLIIDKNAGRRKRDLVKAVHELIAISEAGAAFERAFRLSCTLEYYEQFFLKSSLQRMLAPAQEQIDTAKRRWIKCKYRLAEAQGSRGDKHKNEANRLKKEWNITVDGEPHYPVLQAISELPIPVKESALSKPEKREQKESKMSHIADDVSQSLEENKISVHSKISINDLVLTASVRMLKRRIVLMDEKSEDEVVCGPDKITSNDMDIVRVDGSPDAQAWLLKKWNLIGEIEVRDHVSLIRFRKQEGPAVVGFEITPHS